MLDKYIMGTVNRISPESYCPVLLEQKNILQLGGAANVAYQISRTGRKVELCGIIGNDNNGEEILLRLFHAGIGDTFVFKHDSCTTLKTRFVNDAFQQMFRVDQENATSLTEKELYSIESYIQLNKDDISIIVLPDYDKGVLSSNSCKRIIQKAKSLNIATIVDIKVPLIERYSGATIVKGNLKEFNSFFAKDTANRNNENEMRLLKKEMGASYIVVTLGSDGIMALDKEDSFILCQTEKIPVYDVTGAGDIVTAYISVLISRSLKSTPQRQDWSFGG